MQEKTEKEYVIELKKGSFSAFDHLFFVYKERLFAFAVGYLKVEEDAKELVQEVFVKVWEHRKKLYEDKSFNSYLFTISKNTILNYFRKKANEQSYIEYIKKHTSLSVNVTEEEVEFSELQEKARKVIKQLSARQQEIYKLSWEKGFSNEKIAGLLHISKKTIENQITLIKKILREHMGSGSLVTLLFVVLFF